MAAFVHQPITMPSRAPTTVETPRRTLAFASSADMTIFCKRQGSDSGSKLKREGLSCTCTSSAARGVSHGKYANDQSVTRRNTNDGSTNSPRPDRQKSRRQPHPISRIRTDAAYISRISRLGVLPALIAASDHIGGPNRVCSSQDAPTPLPRQPDGIMRSATSPERPCRLLHCLHWRR